MTGRKADTIVSGGENVAPAEVEAVLEAHPQVLEAAVLGRADPHWGEAVTAIVVARAGRGARGEELRAHCARALAPYKVPKRVVLALRAAAAHALGQAARARELAVSFDAERLPRRRACASWEEAASGWVASPGAAARVRRAGLALDDRRDRPAARRARARAGRRARRDRACWPPSWSRRTAA